MGCLFKDVLNDVGHLVIQRKRLGSLRLKLKQGELLGDLIELLYTFSKPNMDPRKTVWKRVFLFFLLASVLVFAI